jgi:hypothetical protein
MMRNGRRVLENAEIAANWHDAIYTPTLAAIDRLSLGRLYRDAPPGDLFLVLHRHRRCVPRPARTRADRRPVIGDGGAAAAVAAAGPSPTQPEGHPLQASRIRPSRQPAGAVQAWPRSRFNVSTGSRSEVRVLTGSVSVWLYGQIRSFTQTLTESGTGGRAARSA